MGDNNNHNVYNSLNAKFIGSPSSYDGTRNPRIITSWILSFERFSRLAQVPGEVMVELAGTHLVGEALYWFNDFGNSVQNMEWLEFRELLLQRFTDPTHVESIMTRWDNLKQTSTVENYIQEFQELRALVPQKYRTEDGDMRKFIKGLKFKTQFEVESRDPSNLEDAQLKAFKFDQLFMKQGSFTRGSLNRNQGHRGNNFNRNNFSRSNNNWSNTRNGVNSFNGNQQSFPPAVPMELDNVQTKFKKSNNVSKNKVCFRCGKPGHFASNCLKTKDQ